MFSLHDLYFLLCSHDLNILRAQRNKLMRLETPMTHGSCVIPFLLSFLQAKLCQMKKYIQDYGKDQIENFDTFPEIEMRSKSTIR